MKFSTSRFGEISINESKILESPEGILGFKELKKYVVLSVHEDNVFFFLQSVENPAVSFPIHCSSSLFKDEYPAPEEAGAVVVMNIVTIPSDPCYMTANLKAPLYIDTKNKTVEQIVLSDSTLPIRAPIFDRIVSGLKRSAKNKSLKEISVEIPCENY